MAEVDTVEYYTKMIARNILSGRNACGTLEHATGVGDSKYFEKAAEGVISALLEERSSLWNQMRNSIQGETDIRGVLELVGQNLGSAVQISDPYIRQELEKALGRRLG